MMKWRLHCITVTDYGHWSLFQCTSRPHHAACESQESAQPCTVPLSFGFAADVTSGMQAVAKHTLFEIQKRHCYNHNCPLDSVKSKLDIGWGQLNAVLYCRHILSYAWSQQTADSRQTHRQQTDSRQQTADRQQTDSNKFAALRTFEGTIIS